ncbi:hypothetical protein RH858_01170 [Halalkaliarchaeum sp. AArc-GB]|uniref:DUF7096 domain-containing protein n=1 Tax=unclassified Halalkaliarchaeum TaxID=2678344 RepID=UPI00217CCCD3|nr:MULTISPECIES: hypothetical protein [unclassified Halalkaliarchaeum]MDR5671764.1 hypothetical protein [Halalkaliarchaeum sp. AArc-GB]
MNQIVAIAMAIVMVTSAFGATGGAALDAEDRTVLDGDVPVVGQFQADDTPGDDEDGTDTNDGDADDGADGDARNDSVAPGEQFGGVVGVGAAEFKGELDRRAFAAAMAAADTDEERAQLIASLIQRTEAQIEEMENRNASIADQRHRSDLSHGMHNARMATMYAETRSLERALADANATAADIPEETLEEQGVDVAKIDELRDRAGELGGANVAETAREIAGPHAGDRPGPPDGMSHGPPGDGDRGPGHDGGGADDRGPDHDDDDDRGHGGR